MYYTTTRYRSWHINLTIDFAMAFAGVTALLENKNLVFLGTSRGKGYEPVPFATGTCNCQLRILVPYKIMYKHFLEID